MTLSSDASKDTQAPPFDIHQFENFALTAGCKYLEVGGPTSRLEDKILQLGETYGLRPEVFATPSAIIISAMSDKKRFTSSLKRIKESSVDLNLLFKIDVLFDKVIQKDLTIHEANKIISHTDYSNDLYARSTISLASFMVGFLASYLHFQSFASGALSGLLSLMLVAFIQPFFTYLAFTRIFFVFFASLFSIGVSAFAEAYLNLPIEASFIGSLIVLVPGLMLTTAVSELAEHNFVSGTVKLVNGVLVLISIGTALFIGKDIIGLLNPKALPLNFNYAFVSPVDLWTSITGTLLIMLAFCIQFQTPKRLILSAMITGIAGQIGFELFKGASSYALPSFVAALFIGLVSLSFSRLFKTPSQIFSVPGIVSLVPGVLSFTIYNSTSLGTGNEQTDSKMLTVAIIASSLVFGLIMARFPFRLYRKTAGLPTVATE
jgi:uncharacterized membrane protein YjjP (DUF1212 family)